MTGFFCCDFFAIQHLLFTTADRLAKHLLQKLLFISRDSPKAAQQDKQLDAVEPRRAYNELIGASLQTQSPGAHGI